MTSAAKNSKRVLVARLGSMGDILHTLPVPATLKENFPDWEIDWLVERRWRGLLEGNSTLTKIVEWDTLAWRAHPFSSRVWESLRRALRALRERQYDCALDLQGSLKTALACRWSRAREVVGFEKPWLREPGASVFYTRRVVSNAAHIVEVNLALATALGAQRAAIRFPLPPGDASALPRDLPVEGYAVLNPGAGWASKRWAATNYAQICDALLDEFSLPTVLNCGPGEQALAQSVCAACRKATPFLYAGELPGLIALLRRARLMVGPDTGPLHLAAALEVPTLGLYGPTDPRRNGPYGNHSQTLRPEGARTSHRHSAPADGVMDLIRPDAVLEAIHQLLAEQREGAAAARSR